MSADIFVAESSSEDAIVGPLSTITYLTTDEDASYKMLVEGMGMTASDWYIPESIDRPELDIYFGFDDSDNWKVRRFYRDDDGANIQVRLIALEKDTPQIRPAVDGTYLGGLSIGFPLSDSDARETHMSELGFPSVIGVKRLEFSSPAGEKYVSEEVHFTGPENIYVLAVKRPDIFVPVGPLNEEAQIGAPAYSAVCVENCDACIAFYRDILGYEIRRDMTMEVGDNSGLKLRKGSSERFVQAFAPGSNSGYLVLLDHGQDRKRAEGISHFGPPNRGLTMWSFPSANILEVVTRAEQAGVKIRQPLRVSKSPFLPETDTIILEDPNGYPVEIYAV